MKHSGILKKLTVKEAHLKRLHTKAKGGYNQEWEVGMAGVGGSGGKKMETTVLEQQF